MPNQAYDPITASQAVVASSLAGLKLYGNVVDVRVDEETGTVTTDENALTREEFFRVLRIVSEPLSDFSDDERRDVRERYKHAHEQPLTATEFRNMPDPLDPDLGNS